ncbi:AraC family transcriptional regulator [Motiliproteus sp. MSK22-1]|uniref:AraC family transcriptional regulator n=1 Tax=Motiliproteus sp. MSK22-1 TaxID=1897630 RepID=UPI00097687FC|nr:AraC family transcriptional regulator [Motiliproteus sp. MSK22-1]OMH38266.1 AraC family transcriptional regulator [Motiliproteus sp. MSK22-1]
MSQDKQQLRPEFEWVEQQGNQSIRYLEHGAPSPLIRWHYHKEYELHLVKTTSGKMFVGDYIGNFAPGNLVLTGPDLPHNWISRMEDGEDVEIRDKVVQFSPEFITNCQTLMPEFTIIAPMLERARFGIQFYDPDRVQMAEQLIDQLSSAQSMKRLVLFFQILELLATTDAYHILSSDHHKPLIDEKNLVWVNHAVNYIFEHYDRELTLEEVANHMSMGTTYFSKYFKRASGHRFIEFVNRLRVHKACELLAHGEDPITEICFQVGFNNISNFNRRFINLKGMTPREYRRTSQTGLYTSPANQ